EHIDIERRLIGSNLQHVVVDDVDTLIDITFCPAVAEIIRRLETDQIDKMLTPSVHRIMPHVPQKFYRVGSQQKFGLLLKLVKYDLEKKHFCFIFSNKTSRVQFLQQFFRDQLEHVIQFDFPRCIPDYIHLTDRAGSKNRDKVSSFVSRPHEISLAKKIE
ncbi:unnamed protein product, partial [Rotaria sp. Silwood2]